MSYPRISSEEDEAHQHGNKSIGEGLILLGLLLFAVMVAVIS